MAAAPSASGQTAHGRRESPSARILARGSPCARAFTARHRRKSDVKTVQENLGHHTAAFTLDQYGHVTDTMRQASAQRMEAFYNGLK